MKFSEKAFRKWLESFSNMKRVGRPEHRMHCPLCEFLKSQGAEQVSFTFEDRMVDGKLTFNPPWAVKFQRAACNFVDGDGHKQITAKRALSFL